MKHIRFSTPDGQYIVPLVLIAEHRANYYACDVDKFEKNGTEWVEEVEYVMNDTFEGIDWMINNTNFEDWEKVAEKQNNIGISDDDFWCSSEDFEIVETK